MCGRQFRSPPHIETPCGSNSERRYLVSLLVAEMPHICFLGLAGIYNKKMHSFSREQGVDKTPCSTKH